MTTPNFPAVDWDSADVLDGLDVLDKAELIDVPFLITGVYTKTNARGIHFVWVDGQFRDGRPFTFNDSSSTGVRAQILDYLDKKGLSLTSDEDYAEIRLRAPNGLRLSEYDSDVVINGQVIPGRKQRSKTYYLTVSGKRPETVPGPETKAQPKRARSAQ